MSWISKLNETYERCVGQSQFADNPLVPIYHSEQQAHIEITLDNAGVFRGAIVVPKEKITIPVTESSAGRTSGPVPHALCDKLFYLAPVDRLLTKEDKIAPASAPIARPIPNPGFMPYVHQLRSWVEFDPHPSLKAILVYVENGTILTDLVEAGILHADSDGRLLLEWPDVATTPDLFKYLPPNERGQLAAFVRWRVELEQPQGDPRVWLNQELQDSWQRYGDDQVAGGERDLCMVTGYLLPRAVNHPKRIRHGADNAKLISATDRSGFTYHGRFENAEQACAVGASTTQKAHNTLRWLIARQGFRFGSQAVVAWSVSGSELPSILADTSELYPGESPATIQPESFEDLGYDPAMKLRSLIRGYHTELPEQDNVVILALDSAVPGRMAITYFRELAGSEFLDRVLTWHEQTAWPQDMGKERRFVGAPSPEQIAYVAFGKNLDDRLKRATIERLLPCILDARPVPLDLVNDCFHQVCRRAGKAYWEWERALGVACSLIRSSKREENYSMTLEPERRSRSYLFGRLLAVAERIESYGLWLGNEDGRNRSTAAERLMQRFSEKPIETWVTIEISLRPYLRRIRTRRSYVHLNLTNELDEIIGLFNADDFTKSGPLEPEFLLGYHCQRAALRIRSSSKSSDAADETDSAELEKEAK